MPSFQMIKLMPEEEWNVGGVLGHTDKTFSNLGEETKTAEETVTETINNIMLIDHEKTANKQIATLEPGDKESNVPILEHFAVDDVDLTVFNVMPTNHEDILLDAVSAAYYNHQPIVFTPDFVYAYLAKGIALHINKYPEQLRDLFVSHKGKQQLIYRNDDFVKGDKNNDWTLMFQNFADQLKNTTKGNSVVQNDLKFTTSTKMTEAHRNVLTMEGMESYFEYVFLCGCGIACVILEGTLEDWKLLREKIMAQLQDINEYCQKNSKKEEVSLEWWTPCVEILLENFILSYDAQTKGENISENLKLWWAAIYKYNAGRASWGGAPFITGWVNIFFPYLGDERTNDWVSHWSPLVKNRAKFYKILQDVLDNPGYGGSEFTYFDDMIGGSGSSGASACGLGSLFSCLKKSRQDEHPHEIRINPSDYMSYVASVPWKWSYHGDEFNMRAVIGYAILANIVVKGSPYPLGTIKPFPAWVIYQDS